MQYYKIPALISGRETEKKIVGNSLEEILHKITPSEAKAPVRIAISRDELFTDSISFFKKREFDFETPIKEGEPAVDRVRPKREYFTLLLQMLIPASSPIRLLEGHDSSTLHNMDAI